MTSSITIAHVSHQTVVPEGKRSCMNFSFPILTPYHPEGTSKIKENLNFVRPPLFIDQ